jgi:hypothetical protein
LDWNLANVLDAGHVQDVDVDVGVGGSADDLLLGFLGARRVPANKVNGAAPFGDFQRCLKLCVLS